MPTWSDNSGVAKLKSETWYERPDHPCPALELERCSGAISIVLVYEGVKCRRRRQYCPLSSSTHTQDHDESPVWCCQTWVLQPIADSVLSIQLCNVVVLKYMKLLIKYSISMENLKRLESIQWMWCCHVKHIDINEHISYDTFFCLRLWSPNVAIIVNYCKLGTSPHAVVTEVKSLLSILQHDLMVHLQRSCINVISHTQWPSVTEIIAL